MREQDINEANIPLHPMPGSPELVRANRLVFGARYLGILEAERHQAEIMLHEALANPKIIAGGANDVDVEWIDFQNKASEEQIKNATKAVERVEAQKVDVMFDTGNVLLETLFGKSTSSGMGLHPVRCRFWGKGNVFKR